VIEGLGAAVKVVSDLGAIGVLVVALVMVYRLVDKWGGAFLAAQTAQTAAMTQQASAVASLVETVKEGQHDQREVLMAVRTLSDRIERQGTYLEEIEAYVKERVLA
jgi:hypothetical protein